MISKSIILILASLQDFQKQPTFGRKDPCICRIWGGAFINGMLATVSLTMFLCRTETIPRIGNTKNILGEKVNILSLTYIYLFIDITLWNTCWRSIQYLNYTCVFSPIAATVLCREFSIILYHASPALSMHLHIHPTHCTYIISTKPENTFA